MLIFVLNEKKAFSHTTVCGVECEVGGSGKLRWAFKGSGWLGEQYGTSHFITFKPVICNGWLNVTHHPVSLQKIAINHLYYISTSSLECNQTAMTLPRGIVIILWCEHASLALKMNKNSLTPHYLLNRLSIVTHCSWYHDFKKYVFVPKAISYHMPY